MAPEVPEVPLRLIATPRERETFDYMYIQYYFQLSVQATIQRHKLVALSRGTAPARGCESRSGATGV